MNDSRLLKAACQLLEVTGSGLRLLLEAHTPTPIGIIKVPLRHHDPFSDSSVKHMEGKTINPYVRQLVEAQQQGHLPLLHGTALRQRACDWRSGFPSTSGPLYLEIGSYFGHVLADMALDHPDAGFVGMDITYKRVVSAARHLVSKDCSNACVMMATATPQSMPLLFGENELDGVVVFFPDPWLKKRRRARNRLLSKEFLVAMERLVRPGGFIWFKTDAEVYFQEVVQLLPGTGWQVEADHGPFDRDYQSSFQRLFEAKGEPFYQALLRC